MAIELDTDINKIVQQNRVYVAFPALVHQFDAKKGTFRHKKVEDGEAHATALKNGWFATPLAAEDAATKGKPSRTENELVAV